MAAIEADDLHHIIYWDDFPVGQALRLGAFTVPEADAAVFDGAFHDPGRRPGAPLSTMALCGCQMRLMADSHLARAAGLGSPGLDAVQTLGSAQPGERLEAFMTPRMARPLGSRPGVGLLSIDYDVKNSDGLTLSRWHSKQFMRIADPASAQPRGAAAELAIPAIEVTSAPQPAISIGAHQFDHDQILAFARDFDPQPFHLDDEKARDSLFGALCASGWQTCAVFLRLFRDRLRQAASLSAYPNAPSASLSDFSQLVALKWLKPVFVDDVITFTAVEIGTADIGSPSPASVFDCTGTNGNGEAVFSVRVYQELP